MAAINAQQFWQRLQAVHKHWQANKETQWGDASSIMVVSEKGATA
eukprot:SAG31_NODE_27709_length_421_cov_1.062112_1_plen_45_part_00